MMKPTAPYKLCAALAMIVPFAFGCPKEDGAAKKPSTEEAQKPAKGEPAQEPAKPAAATAGTSDPDCIGAWTTEGAARKIELGGKTYEVTGAKLAETSSDPDDQVVFGVIANIKEDTPENMKNVKAMMEFFKAEKIDAVIVDGDLGDNEQQITNVLEPIGALGLPTFVLIGNQEKKADFNNAVKAAQAKHPGIVNMNLVRLALLDDAAIVSMPGYFNKSYIHVETGCHYKATDVEATAAIIKAAGDKAVVLVSHGPPLQKGPESIDWTAEEANVGDPDLSKLMRETGVKLGVFANIREAGGHATNVDGSSVVGEGKLSPELFLNPGPADAVGWKMNDRTESSGMAAVMTVKGKQASFKVHRMPVE